MPRLVVFAGLPGSGKSTLARELARQLGAVWLRIDTIETAIADADTPITDEGYRAAYALAEDNLRLGLHVVGDSVNPWMETRDAWRDVGLRAGAEVIEVEVICSVRSNTAAACRSAPWTFRASTRPPGRK